MALVTKGGLMLIIKNWNTHFETAQSRKVSNLTWVAIPNNLNSRGYRKIMKHPDRAKVFAAWIILIEIASNSRRRGQLGDEDGPYTTEDLELYSDFPKEDFELAIPFLKKIGWVCEQDTTVVVDNSESASSGLVDTGQDSTEPNNVIYKQNSNNYYQNKAHGTELHKTRGDMVKAWDCVPEGRRIKKKKFADAWVVYVEREGVDKERVGDLLSKYYESDEGKSKWFREPFRLLEDEFWQEDSSSWGKDRGGDVKFPDSTIDQMNITKNYRAASDENNAKYIEIYKGFEERGLMASDIERRIAFQIWTKYPEFRLK
jgi:hypothetical protein